MMDPKLRKISKKPGARKAAAKRAGKTGGPRSLVRITAPNQYGIEFGANERNENVRIRGLKKLAARERGKGQKPAPSDDARKIVEKRAKAKFFTQELVNLLLELDSPLKKQYKESLNCAGVLSQVGDKITSRYCGCRWCQVCNRIRTARSIEGYGKQIQAMADPYFLTLTVVNPKAPELSGTIQGMIKSLRGIYNKLQREKIRLVGVRKIECTYNIDEDTYHPHFHLFIDGQAKAERIIEEWLMANPTARPVAQNMKKIDNDNREGSMLELFKYFTKIATDQKQRNPVTGELEKVKGTRQIVVPALDVIFRAMRRVQTFTAMGMKKVKDDINNLEAQAMHLDASTPEQLDGFIDEMNEAAAREYQVNWIWKNQDWIHESTGIALTGFQPPGWIKKLIDNAIY